MMSDLTGKKIVITGGSYGIGLACARSLSNHGAEIIIASRSSTKLDTAKKLIGGNSQTHELDVTDESAVKAFFDKVGAFDHLITPAAGGALGAFVELDTVQARDLVESKLWGQYHCAKYAAPKLRKGATITFFSGIVSRKPIAGGSAYAIIAGAMESLTRTLALELAPTRVNCVSPGVIDTPLWSDLLPEDARQEHMRSMATTLPVGKAGTADDVAKAVLYLIGNDFATGSIVDIDGGHRVT